MGVQGTSRAVAEAGHPIERIGHYTILRRLAAGGMAEIFLARAVGIAGFEKLVIVKRMLPKLLHDAELVALFLHEARLAALLQHSNVVQVFDVGVVEDSYFFAMEFVHGQDARHILKAAAQRRVDVPLDVALTIIRDVCAGLHYAHEKLGQDGKPLGIIHRDVSPSNILVSYDGGVKLVDFGIAKARNRTIQTGYGKVRGKVSYMSPEQWQSRPLDRRSDLFSLGICLYELTTTSRLFRGSKEFAVMRKVMEEPVPSPCTVRPDYPPALAAIVQKALARDRELRYASAEQVQMDIETFAVQNGLTLSAVRVARFLETLFAEQIASWRRSQAEGIGLVEYISSVDGNSEAADARTVDDESVRTTPFRDGMAAWIRGRKRAMRIAGFAMAAVVLLLLGFFVGRKASPADSSANKAVQTSPERAAAAVRPSSGPAPRTWRPDR